jgi:AGZA family xanthine/uracil permease-like MFS transporter
MMAQNIRKIQWDDYSEAIPAFLVLAGIPLTYSIHDGLAMGFIAYPVIKIFSGRMKEASWLIIVVALLFVLRYLFVNV